ncbi:MAG: PIN domain-containing protein [Candidatus Bathyarchaeota archaeon]|nr:PIN domain-containing protein [Candidatus Bathyarchaeota archaeon]
MNIFLDTSAIVAWFNKRDKYYEPAQNVLKEIREHRIEFTRFIISDYILDESLTFFESVIKDHELAVAVGEALMNSSYVSIEYVGEETFMMSWQRFKHSSGLSFTDCTSMTLMDELETPYVFTFDQHFSNAGYSQIR